MAKILLLILVFFLGIIIDRFLLISLQFSPSSPEFKPVRQEGFRYISPLLYCDTPKSSSSKMLEKLTSELENYINHIKNDTKTQSISVYFRDPTAGEWLTINNDEKYTPASLLKLPVLLTYYKEAEKNPKILSNTLVYSSSNSPFVANIKPTKEISSDQPYTIDELINRTIMYSDNKANDLLLANINHEKFDRVFQEINLGTPDYLNTENFMTVEKYASFFRILYNASYLNRESSEKALTLLTKTNFDEGIRAGVPSNIEVSHKFGERSYTTSNLKQLHDCGIIYAANPYLLCIMTKGYDYKTLEDIIKTISAKTYNIATDNE